MHWNKIFTLCLLCVSLTLFVACSEQEKHENAQAPPLEVVSASVEEVREETTRSRIEVVGTLEAIERASISARISGQIIELPVVLGSKVVQWYEPDHRGHA